MTRTNLKLGGRILASVAWTLLVLSLVGTALESGAADIVPLMMSDDPVPDGNGTFLSFESIPTVNRHGQVAFIAGLDNTANPATDGRGIYIVDSESITQLVRTGQLAPDANGVFNHFADEFGLIERVVLSDSGSVAFVAKLAGTAGGTTDNVGLFGASAADGVTQYVRISDPAPDGNGIFASPDGGVSLLPFLSFGIDLLGRVSFLAHLTGTSGGPGVDDRGVFRSDGNSVSRLARMGGTVPDAIDTIDLVVLDPASNGSGEVAIQVFLDFDLGGGGPPPVDSARLYVHNGVLLEGIVRSADPAPDGDGTLTASCCAVIGEGGQVAFEAGVENTSGGLFANYRGIFLVNGAGITEIARSGVDAPDVDGNGTDYDLGPFIQLDANVAGEVAFSGSIERNTAPPFQLTAIYVGDGNGVRQLLREGDPAPDGNGTFGDLSGPFFRNSRGEIVLVAELNGTANPGNDSTGIFGIDSDGAVLQVARAGQSLPGSTIVFADFVTAGLLPKRELLVGGLRVINDVGQVPFVALLQDGRVGLFLTTVPEPSPGLLALAALVTLAVLRAPSRPSSVPWAGR